MMKFSIRVGDDLSDREVDDLRAESKRMIRNRILKIITRREIAASEIARRLNREGYNKKDTQLVIDQLKGSSLIDDGRFVRSLIHDWSKIHPRGNRAIIRELKRNGINPEDYDDLLKERDELAIARSFVSRKQIRIDGKIQRERLMRMLARRGFSQEVISQVIRELGDGLQ